MNSNAHSLIEMKKNAALQLGRDRGKAGFTLLEVMIGSAILLFVFASILATVMGLTAANQTAKGYSQGLAVLRGQMEAVKAMPFDNIQDANGQISYDAGDDGVFGTPDDLTGNWNLQVGDFMDADADGNTAETVIDVDGDGANDCLDAGGGCNQPYARPFRVTFTWSQRVWGNNRDISVSADSLVAR